MSRRSHLTTPTEAQLTAAEYAGLAPRLRGIVRALEDLNGGDDV